MVRKNLATKATTKSLYTPMKLPVIILSVYHLSIYCRAMAATGAMRHRARLPGKKQYISLFMSLTRARSKVSAMEGMAAALHTAVLVAMLLEDLCMVPRASSISFLTMAETVEWPTLEIHLGKTLRCVQLNEANTWWC
jgi:hypothetical protein